MAASFLITFRESLEAALVVGLVLAVLRKSGLQRLRSSVWTGLAAGIAASVAVAWVFILLLGEFEGRQEQLFEGSVMLLGSLLLASLIVWTGSHASGATLEGQTSKAAAGGWWGIALLIFASVLREGVETVIYLGASLGEGGPALLIGGCAGLALALVLGFLIFAAGNRISLGRFFSVTTVLFLLFGAGLFARSLGEFGEAAVLPPLVEHLWDMAPLVEGAPVPAFNEAGTIGSFLKGLFGYSSSPSLSQVIGYVAYAGILAAVLLVRSSRSRQRTVPGGRG